MYTIYTCVYAANSKYKKLNMYVHVNHCCCLPTTRTLKFGAASKDDNYKTAVLLRIHAIYIIIVMHVEKVILDDNHHTVLVKSREAHCSTYA